MSDEKPAAVERVRWVHDSRPATEILSAQLVVAAVAALLNVLAARALGPAGRGELALVVLFSYLIAPVVLLGVDKAYPAAIPRQSLATACRQLTGLVWRPALVAVGVILLAGLALGSRRPEIVGYAACVAALSTANTGVIVLRTATVSARTGLPFLRMVCLTQAVLAAAGLVVLSTPGITALSWVATYAAVNLVPLLWLLGHARSGDSAGTDTVRRLRRKLAPAALGNIVMLRMDRLLIPLLSSTAELGLYAAVVTMTELLYWPVQHYVDAAVPRWREARLTGRLRTGPVVWWTTGYLVASGIVAVLVGRIAVVPLFGAEFTSARHLVLPLVLAACCYGFSRVWFGLNLATGRPGAAMSIDVTGGLVTIAGCLVLIPASGAAGAALASAIGYGAGAVVSVLSRGRR